MKSLQRIDQLADDLGTLVDHLTVAKFMMAKILPILQKFFGNQEKVSQENKEILTDIEEWIERVG